MKKLRPDSATSNSYSTILTRGLNDKMSKIGHELDKVLILNGSSTESLEFDKGCIIIKGEMDNIPAFAHPYVYKDSVIIDARAFVTKEGNIKDVSEYHLLKRRAYIDLAWAMDTAEFGSQADIVTDIFASWFANGLTKRLQMTMVENQYLRILAAIYYLHFLHRSEGLSDEETAITLLKVLPRILRVPAPMIEDVLNAVNPEQITQLYAYAGEKTPNSAVYLELLLSLFNQLTDNTYKLTTALVFNSLARGAFISANSDEIACIAIEHPPTLMIMIWFAMQKGIHGKTTLGVVVGSVSRRHNEDKFNTFMSSIIN